MDARVRRSKVKVTLCGEWILRGETEVACPILSPCTHSSFWKLCIKKLIHCEASIQTRFDMPRFNHCPVYEVMDEISLLNQLYVVLRAKICSINVYVLSLFYSNTDAHVIVMY